MKLQNPRKFEYNKPCYHLRYIVYCVSIGFMIGDMNYHKNESWEYLQTKFKELKKMTTVKICK